MKEFLSRISDDNRDRCFIRRGLLPAIRAQMNDTKPTPGGPVTNRLWRPSRGGSQPRKTGFDSEPDSLRADHRKVGATASSLEQAPQSIAFPRMLRLNK